MTNGSISDSWESHVDRLGRALRRYPGARYALDARVAVRARRARRAAASREAALVERDRTWLRSLAGRTDLRVNVGSSGELIDGWINADLLRDPNCLRMDAVQAWPFEPGSVEAVNSEHFIEHVELEEAAAYLREAFRALRPGGAIRTSTPDLGAICGAYLERDRATLEIHRGRGYVARTHAEMLNTYVRMGGLHKYAYDEETLRLLLGEAGFEEVERAAFGESRHAVLRGIDRHSMAPLQDFAICLDAMKPSVHG